MDTPRSVATSGRMPMMTNSVVPIAKAASASARIGGGTGLLSLRERLRLRNPAPAHRLVEVRVRLEELRLRRDVRELRVEKGLLRTGDLEVDRRAFPVAQVREVAEALQRRDVARLRLARLRELASVDQGVLHFLEGDDDRFLVAGKRLAPEGLALRDLVADAPGVEDRKCHADPVRPRSRRAFEKFRGVAALQTEQAKEVDARE